MVPNKWVSELGVCVCVCVFHYNLIYIIIQMMNYGTDLYTEYLFQQ